MSISKVLPFVLTLSITASSSLIAQYNSARDSKGNTKPVREWATGKAPTIKIVTDDKPPEKKSTPPPSNAGKRVNYYSTPYVGELQTRWGFINGDSSVIIPPIYAGYFFFQDGIAAVKKDISSGAMGSTPNIICGFIDSTGKEVLPFIYTNAANFSEGLAAVKTGRDYFFIDIAGNTIIPEKDFYEVGKFSNGLCPVRKVGGKWGYINKEGKEIIGSLYYEADNFNGDLARVHLGSFYGFINTSGINVIPLKYHNANIVSEAEHLIKVMLQIPEGTEFVNGSWQAKLIDRWGIINRQGVTVAPINYNEIAQFKNGLAKVRINQQWGWIDTTGNVVIPVIYTQAYDFVGPEASVQLDQKWFGVDRTGKLTPR